MKNKFELQDKKEMKHLSHVGAYGRLSFLL